MGGSSHRHTQHNSELAHHYAGLVLGAARAENDRDDIDMDSTWYFSIPLGNIGVTAAANLGTNRDMATASLGAHRPMAAACSGDLDPLGRCNLPDRRTNLHCL